MRPDVPEITSSDAHRRVGFPLERRLVVDTLHLGRNKPMLHGLLEVDVTRARALVRAHRERTGEALSFTAFVLACVGRAVAAHPEVHALRDWRGRLVMFEDVDVTTIVEVEVEGRPFPLARVVRATNRRTPKEIHDEIRAIQASGVRSLRPRLQLAARIALRLPGFIRRLAFRLLVRSPRFAKRHTGTVLLTAVGMFGAGAAWGMSAPGIHGLTIVVGGIATRPATSADTEAHEVLCLTVSADHTIVDGAPLARFVRDLRDNLEAADGLSV